MNDLYEMFIRDSETSKAAEVSMRAEMLKRIGPGHEELKEKLIPSWPPGCAQFTSYLLLLRESDFGQAEELHPETGIWKPWCNPVSLYMFYSIQKSEDADFTRCYNNTQGNCQDRS